MPLSRCLLPVVVFHHRARASSSSRCSPSASCRPTTGNAIFHGLQRHQRRPPGAERRLLRRRRSSPTAVRRCTGSSGIILAERPRSCCSALHALGTHGHCPPLGEALSIEVGPLVSAAALFLLPALRSCWRRISPLRRQAPEPAGYPGLGVGRVAGTDLFLVHARQHHGQPACRLRPHPDRRDRSRP